ncbi:MAG: UMP kinase [Nanoarchaeota archaeon]
MRIFVISLGGSLIIPDKINFAFLNKFKKEVRKNYKKTRFVVVCGGGSVARKYISALKMENKSERDLSNAGIMATRMNAKFLIEFFGKEANGKLPFDMNEVANNLYKNNIVICGALRYAVNETSDGTAAKLAHFLSCGFINMTNVKGLYTSDPKKNKNARFISKITWKDFEKMAKKMKFEAGQHFVLDQSAAEIIRKRRIKTYIINENIVNITKIVDGNKFIGTTISG